MSPSPSDAGSPAGEGFPRSVRLRRSADFQRVQRFGRRTHGPHLVVVHLANKLDTPRFGLAVSRKVGSAVVRNRVKRWLREAVRRQRAGVPPVDVVLIARPSSASAGADVLAAEIASALARVRKEFA